MDCELGIYILLNIIVSVILPVTSEVSTEIEGNKNNKSEISEVNRVEAGNSIQNGNTPTSNSSKESTNHKRHSTQNIDNHIDKLTENNVTSKTNSNIKPSNNSIRDTEKFFNNLTDSFYKHKINSTKSEFENLPLINSKELTEKAFTTNNISNERNNNLNAMGYDTRRGDIPENKDDEYPTTENTSSNNITILLETTTNLRNSSTPDNIKTSTLPTNDRSVEALANKTNSKKIFQFNELFEKDTSVQIPISHIIFNLLENLKEYSTDNNY